MQSNNVNFVTDGSKVYRLAGNEWYVVEQDDDKVMLVDTDCKIGDEELRTPWSDGNCRSEEGENGQAILDYCNNLVDTYFSGIKHAILPRTVNAGTCKLEDAYMWSMSYEGFKEHRNIGGKIVYNSNGSVWTRTFRGVYNIYHRCANHRCAWYVGGSGDVFSGIGDVVNVFRVAPTFYLRKSAIDHISEDGEIVLKPADTVQNTSSDAEKLLSQVREYAKVMADVNRFKQKLAYEQGDNMSAAKTQEIVDMCECILYLASNTRLF